MTTVPLMPLHPRGGVLGDEVYDAIGRAILEGRLPPGEHLHDHELARWLGVSRTPVREALQRLERIGLVEVAPHRYTRVTTPEPALVGETYEFVVLLLGDIVRLAVARCTDETLAEVLKQIDVVIEASRADDRLGIIDGSAVLFTLLTHAAANRAFIRVMREAELVIRRNLSQWHPFVESPAERSEGYLAFRKGIAARDGDAAERALRAQYGPAETDGFPASSAIDTVAP